MMSNAVRGTPQIEPAATALLSDPLDFFFGEHFRQRKLCNLIEGLAFARALDSKLAREVLDFLRHDLVLHVADEEADLFAFLRRYCPPEDEIERVLAALSAEHAGGRHLAAIVIDGLQQALSQGLPVAAQAGLREAMIDFARNERRHLALENAVVLPLARRRLPASALAELSARLTARRATPPGNPG